MPTNIEIKARCADPDRVRAVGGALVGVREESMRQVDTYLATARGRLKIRADGSQTSVIFYRRPSSPLPKQSDYRVRVLTAGETEWAEFLKDAVGVRQVVDKRRTVWSAGAVRVHLDAVDGLGDFVELEIDAEAAGGDAAARAIAADLMEKLAVDDAELIAWSYADLTAMTAAAARWRKRLAEADAPGRLVLIDGASCSGKTTLVERVRRSRPNLSYVPRFCTRDPRPGEVDGDEYLFVSHERFLAMAGEGAFLEYRDFEFGMSYGLGWKDCLGPVLAGGNALGVINLGSGRHVKELFPEAVTILVDPPLETIRRRLVGRGINKPHEIEERLGNARRVASYRRFYDHVIDNDDGRLDDSLARLARIIDGG